MYLVNIKAFKGYINAFHASADDRSNIYQIL